MSTCERAKFGTSLFGTERERERDREREMGGGGRGWQGAPISANISLTISDMT